MFKSLISLNLSRKSSLLKIVPIVLFFLAFGSKTAAAESASDVLTEMFFIVSDTELNSDPCVNYPRTFGQYNWYKNSTNALTPPFIYLCLRRDPLGHEVHKPITNLTIEKFDSKPEGDICPNNYTVVSSINGPQDMNQGLGADTKYLYLCYTKDPTASAILDVDIVALGACQIGWDRIDQNLNEGHIAAVAGMTLCYLELETSDFSFTCGGEGESACEAFSLFSREQFSFDGCDRGLENDNDICRSSSRRQQAATDFATTWEYWALLNQTNQVALDVPLSRFSQLGAHNAFNSVADGYIDPNQRYSITDQLRAGIRVIDLDIYAVGILRLPKLCHGPCSPGDRLFDSALKEIKHWMLQPENLDQTILIILEDYIDTFLGEVGVIVSIDEHLVKSGIGVVRREQLGSYRPPTRAEMLAANTRVAIFSQNQRFGNFVHLKADNDGQNNDDFLWNVRFGILITDFDAGVCNSKEDSFLLPVIDGLTNTSEINGDRRSALDPDKFIDSQHMQDLINCGIDIINIDDFLNANDQDSTDRLKKAIWSWKEGDKGEDGDAVALDGDIGKWRSRERGEAHKFACKAGNSLFITQNTGRWTQGWSICDQENPGSEFFVPVSGWENAQLVALNTEKEHIWLNYNDILENGKFVISTRPEIELSGPDDVNESDQEVIYEIKITSQDAPDLANVDAQCGTYGVLVENSLIVETRRAEFKCTFALGGISVEQPYVLTTVSATATDISSVIIPTVEQQVTVNNVAPDFDISNLVLSSNLINEGATVTLSLASFYDPGIYDQHQIVIAWGDGQSERIDLRLGSRSFSISHTYSDDNPTATPSDLMHIVLQLSDESSFKTASKFLTVQNIEPEITLFDLSDSTGRSVKDGLTPVLVGLNVAINTAFSDLGLNDTHATTINLGDGSSPVIDQASATHVYLSPGRYSVSFTVVDDDTGEDEQTAFVNVLTAAGASGYVVQQLKSLPYQNNLLRRAISYIQGSADGRGNNGAIDAIEAGKNNLAIKRLKSAIALLKSLNMTYSDPELESAITTLELIIKSINEMD